MTLLHAEETKPIELEDVVDVVADFEVLEEPMVESPQETPLEAVEWKRVWCKAPVLRRVIADVIDRLLCCPLIVCFFPPWLAVVIAYDLLSDGLLDGCSVGKRLMGLRTVMVSNGKPCNFARSFLRNVGWAAARLCYTTIWLIPFALVYDAIELLLVLFSPSGQRLGDRLAGTQVTTE
jgi:uncharacterized RDD family membrane protein YckC